MNNVTFCGIFYNEQERLSTLLPLIKKYCDKLVCVVQKSTDKTLEICNQYCDIVIERPLAGYSECDRGILLSSVCTEWVLYLDADETPTDKFLSNIRTLISKNVDVYGMTTKHGIDGSIQESILSKEIRYRLFRKDACYSLLSYHSDWRPYKNKIIEDIQYTCIEHTKSMKEHYNDISIAEANRYKIPFNPAFTNSNAKDIPLKRYCNSVGYYFNIDIAKYLVDKFVNKSVYDFNCGDASYTNRIVINSSACNAFSSHKLTPIITRGVGSELDISKEKFDSGFPRDWSISISENIFVNIITLENLARNSKKGIIIKYNTGCGLFISAASSELKKFGFIYNKDESNKLNDIGKCEEYRYVVLEK